jgi:hypothetical protein
MTNALAKTNQYSPIDANIGADLDGDLLRFNGKVGRFFKGPEKVEVPPGRRLKFAPLSVQDGYQKWIDGKIEDERWREWNSTTPPILRNDLGDLDQEFWHDGKDPWSFTLRAAFKEARGGLLKFVTTSTGGINAIRRTMRTWRTERDNHPGLVPMVELGVQSYVHKIHRTEIITPTLTIIAWTSWDGEGVQATPPKALPKAEPRTTAQELDDEIPF